MISEITEIGVTSNGFKVYRYNIIKCDWDVIKICPDTGKIIKRMTLEEYKNDTAQDR